jgi:hypothetical protein
MRRQTPAELEEACNAFNSVAPVGTKVRICKGARHHPEAKWIDTEVTEPGAYVMGGHTAVVKVPGDSIALTNVEVVQ